MKSLAYLVSLSILFLFAGGGGACNIQPGTSAPTLPESQPFNSGSSKADVTRAKLIKYISKRTVRVVCKRNLVDTLTDSILLKNNGCGWGTGTIIRSFKDRSYILTADHVVDGPKQPKYFIGTKWVYRYQIERRNLKNEVTSTSGGAVIVMSDKARDIAVLKVPYNLGLQSSVSHKVVLGQEAHVMGYPWLVNIKGSHLSYTHGFIGTMHMGNDKKKSTKEHDRFDMDVYMGNSGSAVWDNNGRIVGMVNWVTGMRFSNRYFLPQPKQTYGCSARGILNSFEESGKFELSKF